MRSWFEFGYDGFPKGAQRRRFYQQRDDPCDSEEERDNDDESGDRPVLHLPLPQYASSSTSSRGSSYASEGDHDGGQSDIPAGTAVLNTTVDETKPARYGSSVVSVTVRNTPKSPRRRFVIEHGGVCVATQTVLNTFAVAELTLPSSQHTVARTLPATFDSQLLERVDWEALHPHLVVDSSGGVVEGLAEPPCRYGHCAAELAGQSTARVALQLSKPSNQVHQWDSNAARGARRDLRRDGMPGLAPASSSSTANPPFFSPLPNETISLSLVLGGAVMTVSQSGERRSSRGSGGGASPHAGLPPSATLNHPVLVLTLLSASASQNASSRYVTKCFPLGGSSSLLLPPRVFATLSPWPTLAERDVSNPTRHEKTRAFARPLPRSQPHCVHRFAYLGGSEDGREPTPLFPVTQLELDTTTWSVHHSIVETYGTEPAPRHGHSATAWGHQLYIFGGIGRGRAVLNDLYTLDADTLVWREVFIPSHYDVPRRAFHVALVVPMWGRHQRIRLNAEARRARWLRDVVRPAGAASGPTCHEGEKEEEERERETHHSAQPGELSLLLIGGETAGGTTVPTVCSMDLASQQWRQWSLRLADHRTSEKGLSRRQRQESVRLRRVLTILADKEGACREQASSDTIHPQTRHRHPHLPLSSRAAGINASTAFDEGTERDSLSTLYFGALLGGLGTAIALHGEADSDDDEAQRGCLGPREWDRPHGCVAHVVLWGGTRSPPVQLLTQLDFPDESVRSQCCLWLAAHAVDIASVMPPLVPILRQFIPASLLSVMRGGWVVRAERQSQEGCTSNPTSHTGHTRGNEETEHELDNNQCAAVPSSLARQAVELGNQAAMEDQLSEWHRAALRRLREH